MRQAMAVVLAVTLAGCGTLMGGGSQGIRVASDPTGSLVVANPGDRKQTTPATLSLERRQNYTLTFSKDGYSTETVHLDRKMRTGVLIADLLLFPAGVIVDAITGGWYKLSPDTVSAHLRKLSADVAGPDVIEVAIRSGGKGGEVHVTADSAVAVAFD